MIEFKGLPPYYYARKPTCPRCGQELTDPREEVQTTCPTCHQKINWTPRKETPAYARDNRIRSRISV